MSQIKCLYCLKVKDKKEFSLEHIFPQSLGGSLCPDFFKTRNVCGRCNSLLGLFVDAPYVKSWYLQNAKSTAGREYIDIENGSILPLNYMGILDGLDLNDDEICEFWLGPCGDRIYHFHSKDESAFESYVGGNPISRKKDSDYAFIFLSTDDKRWIRISLLSFANHFKKTMKYAGNFDVKSDENFSHEIPHNLKSKYCQLEDLNNVKHKCCVNVNLDVESRLISKLALAFGYKFLGDDYLESKYAIQLRDCLWEKDIKNREMLDIKGSGLYHSDNELHKLLSWNGGHVISFSYSDDYLLYNFSIYGSAPLNAIISDEPKLWKDKDLNIKDYSQVYIVIPQLKGCYGPFTIWEYISHIKGEKINFQLRKLEELRVEQANLPPYLLP